MSEAMLAMVLDLDVERNKREIAEAFSAARKRLIPPPPEKSALQLLAEGMTNCWNPATLWSQRQNAAQLNAYNHGGAFGFGGSILGISTPWF